MCARHVHALVSPRDATRATRSSSRRCRPLSVGVRAVASTYVDVEALWQKVDFAAGRERAKTSVEWATLKESCWFAAYDVFRAGEEEKDASGTRPERKVLGLSIHVSFF